MSDPASIRYFNPGAMWPGSTASQYGSTQSVTLRDGNKIAVFPDAVSGASAQFGLLNSKYAGLPLKTAIRKWSGGNSSDDYTKSVSKATGLGPDDVLTPDVLKNPAVAIPLAKSSARWEAGKDYPLSDDDWNIAFARSNAPPGAFSDATIPDYGGAGLRSALGEPEPTAVASNATPSSPTPPQQPAGAFSGIMPALNASVLPSSPSNPNGSTLGAIGTAASAFGSAKPDIQAAKENADALKSVFVANASALNEDQQRQQQALQSLMQMNRSKQATSSLTSAFA